MYVGAKRTNRKTPTYASWLKMREHCRKPKAEGWVNYGGRGLRVCTRWEGRNTGFDAFVEDMGVQPDGTTLDRVDVNGHYEPGNCRWATAVQERANRRSARPTAR